jgi:hypothetical protein
MSALYRTQPAKVTSLSSVTDIGLPRTAPEETVDLTLQFLNDNKHLVAPLTPADESKLKTKLYTWVLLLALVIELMLYVNLRTVYILKYAIY